MKIKIKTGFTISFIALLFLMNEAHEIVHTTVGRIICGCWGKRDFNVWDLCEGCLSQHPSALFATFAGPVFTFIMIWVGAFYLGKNKSAAQRSFGFALIFANMPFARLFQPLAGGGDEVWALSKLMQNHTSARIVGFTIILLITIYPLYKAYKLIGNKRRLLWFLLFFLTPVLIDQLFHLGLMNNLLEKGVLNNYWILGSPVLITVWTFLMLVIFLITRKNIYKLFDGGVKF
ncbi:MAG: hypothetical protein ABUT20_40195 [Bacteroidota bacterium]